MWCMRFEAKNSYFKKVGQSIGNFKNIAKTVATCHQRMSCYNLAGNDSIFLKNNILTGQGTIILHETTLCYSYCTIFCSKCFDIMDTFHYADLLSGKSFTHRSVSSIMYFSFFLLSLVLLYVSCSLCISQLLSLSL